MHLVFDSAPAYCLLRTAYSLLRYHLANFSGETPQ
jgi:hypothetical protein